MRTPGKRIYVKGYDLLSSVGKCGDKYGKKRNYTATKFRQMLHQKELYKNIRSN